MFGPALGTWIEYLHDVGDVGVKSSHVRAFVAITELTRERKVVADSESTVFDSNDMIYLMCGVGVVTMQPTIFAAPVGACAD
jgi:hypothetical protein